MNNWNLSSDGSVAVMASPAPSGETRSNGTIYDAFVNARGATIAQPAISPRSALTLAGYFAAINVLSMDLACLPLKVYRERKSGGKDRVTDDPREDLMGLSPDGITTGMRFRQAMYGHMLGWGNGYADIQETGGAISALKLLEPTTEPSERSRDKTVYYRLPGGETRRIDEVIHVAGFGYDGLRGYSPARLMSQTLAISRNSERFGANFFNNGMRPTGYFEAPQSWDRDKAEEYRKQIDQIYGGTENVGRPLVLWNGWKWAQASIPPEEAQFLETRQFQILEIARMFRLPPHKLGDFSQAHFTNIEESNLEYKTNVLTPWCTGIEQEFNRKLFTRQERAAGFYCKHNLDAFLRGNSATRAAMYTAMFGLGVYDIDEIRALEDLNPLEEFGSERFLTVQAKPLRVAMMPATTSTATTVDPAPTAEAEPEPTPVPSAEEADPNAEPVPADTGSVADTALNGAQIASLLEVVTLVTQGELPKASAAAIIKASFPTLTYAQINAILDPIVVEDTPEPPEAGAPPGNNPDAAESPTIPPASPAKGEGDTMQESKSATRNGRH